MSSIDELKSALRQIPLSQIVGQFIPLQKKGQNYEGLCPFHPDHNPSLKVSDPKGLFKCFVCGKAGNAITFAMEFKKWDFKTALVELGNLFQLDTSGVHQTSKQELHQLPYYQFMEKVIGLYRNYTQKNRPVEWEHFLKERSIEEDLAEQFELAYAPRHSLLLQTLNGLPTDEYPRFLRLAKELSLVKETNRGELRDTFRHRILFPIRNHSGRLVGLGSRAIMPEQMPKYLNSAESKIFNKRKVLYAFHRAKSRIQEKQNVIITEGYMDALTLHKHGFGQAVASMGTAFSADLVKFLTTLKVEVYFAFDRDQAGQMALDRVAPLFLAQKLLVKTINLEPCKDPDEFLKRFGTMAMEERMQQARYWIDEKMSSISSQETGDNKDLKIQKLRELFALASPLEMALEATERLIEHAKILGLNTDAGHILEIYQTHLQESLKPASHRRQMAIPLSLPEEQMAAANDLAKPQPPSEESAFEPTELPWPEGANFLLKQVFTYPGLFSTNYFAEIIQLVYNVPFRDFLNKLALIHKETPEGSEGFFPAVLDHVEQTAALRLWKEKMADLIFSCRPQTIDDKGLQRVGIDLLHRWKLMTLQQEAEHIQRQCQAPLSQGELNAHYDKIFKLKMSINELQNQIKKSPLLKSSTP